MPSVVSFNEKTIDAIFAGLNTSGLPGAAVGIAVDGRPVYRKGFGLASMELPVVLAPTTRMRIYSTTKHFACFAYLLLCEQGLAGLDDPLVKFLPELHPVTHRVTVRQVMGNISGLRDAHDVDRQFSGTGNRVSSADVLSLYRHIDDVSFAPGTGWSYNNGGFLLLTAAIERITGQSLETVLRTRIFQPVGMLDTLLRRVDTDFVPNSATLHMTTASGEYDRSYMGTAAAAEGGLVSTVDDMLRWLAHMDNPSVGTPESWALMKSPQILVNGASTGYALGLMCGRYRGVATVHHPGGGQGGSAQMIKVPHAGLDVAIMVNRHDVSAVDLADRVLGACLPGLPPLTQKPEAPPVEGTFRSPTTGRIAQLLCRAGQQLVSFGANDLPFALDVEHSLRPVDALSYMRLKIDPADRSTHPAAIRLEDFGSEDTLLRLPPADSPDASQIVGHYRSEATATDVTIFIGDAGPRLEARGRFGSAQFALECLSPGVWRTQANPVIPWLGGILAFTAESDAFGYSNLLTRSLPFRRCS